MIFRRSVFIFISSFIFIQCDRVENSTSNVVVFDPQYLFKNERKPLNSVIGDWQYGFPFYSCQLSLTKEGTFKFSETGCTGTVYTEGAWRMDQKMITLNSFNCYLSLSESEIDITNFNDTVYDYFKNKYLLLDIDTLYALDENGLKTNLKLSL
jgi:hypothetical protein